MTVAVVCLACEDMRKLLRLGVRRANAPMRASSLANSIRNLYPAPVLIVIPDARSAIRNRFCVQYPAAVFALRCAVPSEPAFVRAESHRLTRAVHGARAARRLRRSRLQS